MSKSILVRFNAVWVCPSAALVLSLNPYWLDLTKLEGLTLKEVIGGLNPYWLDLTRTS